MPYAAAKSGLAAATHGLRVEYASRGVAFSAVIPGFVTRATALEVACPTCGVVTGRVKDRPLLQIQGLPTCGQQTQLWWRKRRLESVESVESVVPTARVHAAQHGVAGA